MGADREVSCSKSGHMNQTILQQSSASLVASFDRDSRMKEIDSEAGDGRN